MATTKVDLKLDKNSHRALYAIAKTANTSVDVVVNVLLASFLISQEKADAPPIPRKTDNKKPKT